jgi:hypothetical protein
VLQRALEVGEEGLFSRRPQEGVQDGAPDVLDRFGSGGLLELGLGCVERRGGAKGEQRREDDGPTGKGVHGARAYPLAMALPCSEVGARLESLSR